MIQLPKFRNLKDLEKYVQQKVEKTIKSEMVQDVFKDAMQDSVHGEVYAQYKPLQYERRGDNDGLSDKDNMIFTQHTKQDKTLVSLFENVTVGSDYPAYDHETDSMNGYFISNLIEHGSDNIHETPSNSTNGWYELGKWSEARPFVLETALMLNNPSFFNARLKWALEKGINN